MAFNVPHFFEQINLTYAAIAKRIEELVAVFNESDDLEPAGELTEKIKSYLRSLERSLSTAKQNFSSLPKKQQHDFLRKIAKEISDIKELEAYLELARRKPTPPLIRKINALYLAIAKELKDQEAGVR